MKNSLIILLVFFSVNFISGCNSDNSGIKATETEKDIIDTSHNYFTFDSLNFSITYPPDWIHVENKDVVLALKDKCDSSQRFCTSSTITVVERTDSLYKYVNTFIEHAIEKRHEKYKIIAITEPEDTGSVPGYYIVDYIFQSDSLDLGATAAIFETNDNIIMIHFIGLNMPNNNYEIVRKEIPSILKSIVVF